MKRHALDLSLGSLIHTDTTTSSSNWSISDTDTSLLPPADDDGVAARSSLASSLESDANDDADSYDSYAMSTSPPPSPQPPQLSTCDMIERMRDAVLAAAAHSTQAVRREALSAQRGDPARYLRHVQPLALSDTPRNVALYQCTKTRRGTTRVLGLTHLCVPIHEIVSVLSHKSILSGPLLNPGLAQYETLHTILNNPTQYVAIKSLVMHAAWNAPYLTHARNLVVIESHEAFETNDGRRGWVVSYHSLAWPGCPAPPRGTVRGSVYNTGIVAVERTRQAARMDIYSVAELKLKREATSRADWAAATDRVLDTLALLKGTIESRAGWDTAILKTAATVGTCTLCIETTNGRGRTRKKPLFQCRKCGVSVCNDCSTLWQRSATEIRLCLDCWSDATLEF